MRAPKRHEAQDGTITWRVRYRQAGVQTSETFRNKADADEFSAHLSGGGVTAALAWLDARENAADALTLGEWFETYVDQLTGVTDRTRNSYRSIYNNHLAHLGRTPLTLLTRAHMTALVNDMERNGKSPKTIKNTFHMLSSCLRLAIDEQHIARNPCARVKLPKKQRDDRPQFLTHEEAGAIIAHMPEQYRALTTFLFGTGLRWSEATALQVRHVNLQAGTVRVEQAWKAANGKELGPPKSDAGFRTVNAATAALVAVEPRVQSRKPSEWLFTTPSGTVVRYSNYRERAWLPACRAAGIDPIPGVHVARHSHASWLISDGIQLEAVQDQLGHESILTTRKVYGHLLPALGVAVGKSASAAMQRALADGPHLRALPAVTDDDGTGEVG